MIAVIIIAFIILVIYWLFFRKKKDNKNIFTKTDSAPIANFEIIEEPNLEEPKEEIIIDENGLNYKNVIKKRDIPRKTYLYGLLHGKYWGEFTAFGDMIVMFSFIIIQFIVLRKYFKTAE